MSQAVERKTKKRKHVAADGSVAEPSTKRSKTAKTKRDKDSNKAKEGKKKGKSVGPSDSQFKVVKATLALSIPPVFAMKPREGAEEMLDSMVMRYVPALQGVMLAHDNLEFTAPTATIKGECPFSNCTVKFDSTVWSPHVGMKLVGKVKLCSPDHVALLVHRTFNVSIPRHHIPTDQWEFEYGPLENDPEYGASAASDEGAEASSSDATEGSGRWIHKLTGEKLGGEQGQLQFTVIGLTIANQMLSLVASIQHDPFSPAHVPSQSITTATPSKRHLSPPAATTADAEMLDDDVDSDEVDTFETLGRLNDAEMAEREAKRRKEEEEKKQKEERKRKRKAEKAAARAEDAGEQPEKKKRKQKDTS